jgi:hypothetical protein
MAGGALAGVLAAPRYCIYVQSLDAATCPLSRCRDQAKPQTGSVTSDTGPSRARCTAWAHLGLDPQPPPKGRAREAMHA